MKRTALIAVLGASLLFLSLHASAAPPKDERNLDKEIAGLDRTAAGPGAEQAVVGRIQKDLRVDPDRVQALRGQGLSYGEIVAVLSLAKSMPGGLTDANIDQVRILRAGPPQLGWAQVAAQVKAKLGAAVSQVRKTENEVRRAMKQGSLRTGGAPDVSRPTPTARKRSPLGYPGEGRSLPQGRAAD